MLLDNQLANGTWGLYRGAAMRAGLLTKDFTRLSQVAEESCTARPPLADIHCKQTLALLEKALRDSKAGAVFQTKAMPELVEAMALVVTQMPQKELLKNLLVSTPDITRELAASAVDMDDSWGWQRRLLGQVMHERPALRDPIANAIRCESFIGPVESAFWWICSQKGRRLPESAADLPLNTTKLQNAISNFCNSGHYPPGGSRNRFHLYTTRIDVTSKSVFLESVMALHARIAEERKRSPWVLLEDGKIVANVDVGEPLGDAQLQSAMDPDSAWRNDYYLHPLRSLGKQLGIDGEGAR
jgi:hypothetical protein